MKSQVFEHSIASASQFPRGSQLRYRFAFAMLLCLLAAAFCQSLAAQENFLVVTQDGVVNLVDLTTYSPIESTQNDPFTYTVSASPNNRLAFMAGGGAYGSAFDTSIERAITRLKGVRGSASTIGHSGKYYLVSDYNTALDIVDTDTLMTVRTVGLGSVLPSVGLPGAIVAANDQAYLLGRGQAQKVAVVNLTTFQLASISVPTGFFCRHCAARVPDGSIVVVVENERSDGKTHVLLINTTTNQIISDFPQISNYVVSFLVVTPNSAGSLLGYVYASSSGSVMTLDLRPNSPTYGQILANTAVAIPNLTLSDMAINSDGSRIIAIGTPYLQPPAPNVAVVDTVNQVLATQLTIDNGVPGLAVCTGFFSTINPNTAPTVTGVSGDIINNQDNDVTITGTNFQPGALVRIGSLPPIATNFLGSNMLSVTVPAGAPAGKAQDIIVTNPMTNAPPNQQNQSGLLAGKFNISPNPIFQPATPFATGNGLLYLYDLKQQSMVNVPTGHPGDYISGFAFNVDGKALYLASTPFFGSLYVLPVDLSTNTSKAPISLPPDAYNFGQQSPLGGGRDPQKDTPVMYLLWSDADDLRLSKIDSDSSSPTYNTIVATFNAGLGVNSNPIGQTLTVTADGKYAYVWYYTDFAYLGIYNLSTSAFTSIRYDNLRVYDSQVQIGITTDGQSMLLATNRGNRTRIKVFDISNPVSPRGLTEITPLPISRWGFPEVYNYQVVNDKLYGVDSRGAVVVFNFDRTHGNFRERGYVAADSPGDYSGFAFSSDGAYLYLAGYNSDLVLVADTSKLEKRGDPTVTNIRSPYTPYLLAVSPVAPPLKAATAKHSGGQQRSVQPRANE